MPDQEEYSSLEITEIMSFQENNGNLLPVRHQENPSWPTGLSSTELVREKFLPVAMAGMKAADSAPAFIQCPLK